MKPSKLPELSQAIQNLYYQALKARERSYSPYSGYKVGSAILLENGKVFAGCNIENSSFGATVCAERVAIQKAISEEGTIPISIVMVITDASPPWPPCGICRQVLAEFGPNAVVYLANLKGDIEYGELSEIYPHAFTSGNMGP